MCLIVLVQIVIYMLKSDFIGPKWVKKGIPGWSVIMSWSWSYANFGSRNSNLRTKKVKSQFVPTLLCSLWFVPILSISKLNDHDEKDHFGPKFHTYMSYILHLMSKFHRNNFDKMKWWLNKFACALERGILHFLSRFVAFKDSNIFTPLQYFTTLGAQK